GHHPVRRSGSAAIHPSPVIKQADAVNAADAWEVRETVVMRTTRHHLVDVLQRGRFNLHQHFAFNRLRIGEVFTARGLSRGMQNGSFHVDHISFRYSSVIDLPFCVRPSLDDWAGLSLSRSSSANCRYSTKVSAMRL